MNPFRLPKLPNPGLCLFLLALFLLPACEVVDKVAKTATQPTPLVEYRKNGCFGGRCPVYALTVNATGLVTYKGERNTNRMGLFAKQLKAEELATCKKLLEEAGIWQAEEYFPSDVADLPGSVITQYDGEHSKTIQGQRFPQNIAALDTWLEQLANSAGWVLKEKPDFGLPDDVVPGVMRIQLRPEVTISFWMAKYYQANMEVIQMLQEANNYWLVRFDPSLVYPRELEELLRFDEEVVKFDYQKRQGKKPSGG